MGDQGKRYRKIKMRAFNNLSVHVNYPTHMQRFQVGDFHWYFRTTWSYTFFNFLLTQSAYHVLKLWEIMLNLWENFFAFWLIKISSGWKLLAKLCGTLTNSQLFSNIMFNFGDILTFEGIHHDQQVLLLWVTKLLFVGFKVGKDDFLKQSDT